MEGNSGGAIELEQAWGQYDFAKNHGFRGGIMLVPVGRFNLCMTTTIGTFRVAPLPIATVRCFR